MNEKIDEQNYMLNDLVKGGSEELFPGNVLTAQQDGEERHRYLFACDNGVLLRVHVVTDRVVRFRYATEGSFDDDFSYAVTGELASRDPEPESSLEEGSRGFLIRTRELKITVLKDKMKTRIEDRRGILVLEEEKGFHWEENVSFGGNIVISSKEIAEGECFFGLGDKSCELNLRGRRLQLWGTDTYGFSSISDPLYRNIPFYIGLHGKTSYGIFFDNTFRSFFDFGHERTDVASFWAQGGEMNYYFIYGPEQQEVVEAYTHLTGRAEMPPMWALGYHQCKWSYDSEKVFKRLAADFRKKRIPCDAIYLDIDYMDGFRCFTWDLEDFPDPKRMIRELADDGFKTVAIIDPGIKIDPDYHVYQQGLEKDLFCRRGDGPLMKGSVWPGKCHFPDFLNPEAREWWATLFKGLIAEDGLAGVWNDMNEPAVFEEGTFQRDVRHDFDGHDCSHRKGHNVYGMQMARATRDGVLRHAPDKRPFVITRSGYSGVQRFSSVWTGDNVASWDHLRIANRMCQRLSMSGISFCGSDIGGFVETPSGELYTRWIQMGIFHPFCRTHSSQDHGDQEPWSFGDKYTNIVRKFLELRYQLLPYIYTAFWQYAEFGTPMLRSLVYLDQQDTETHYRLDEFGLGDSLLICPITKNNVEGRWLYPPRGKWFNYWSDEQVTGGMEVWSDAPLNQIPLFIKAGTVLPMWPVQQYVGEKKIEQMTLHVYWTEGEHESVLYEDAGEGHGYKSGEKVLKTFQVTGSREALDIYQKMDGDFHFEYQTCRLVLHGLPFKPHKCGTVDGDADTCWEISPGTGAAATGAVTYVIDKVPANFRDVTIA